MGPPSGACRAGELSPGCRVATGTGAFVCTYGEQLPPLQALHSSGCGRETLTSPRARVVCTASAPCVHFASFSLWVFSLACGLWTRRLVRKDMSDTWEISGPIERNRMQSEAVALLLGLYICAPEGLG